MSEEEEMVIATQAKSNQVNAIDLMSNNKTIVITKVEVDNSKISQRVTVHYEGENKRPYKPSKGMSRAIMKAWGKYKKNYIGKTLELCFDPKALYAGKEVGGIIIYGFSDIEADFSMSIPVARTKKRTFNFKKLEPKVTAEPVDPKLVQSGEEAANKGLEDFTKWGKTLTPEEKTSLSKYLSDWTKTAKAVVVEAEQTEEEDWIE